VSTNSSRIMRVIMGVVIGCAMATLFGLFHFLEQVTS